MEQDAYNNYIQRGRVNMDKDTTTNSQNNKQTPNQGYEYSLIFYKHKEALKELSNKLKIDRHNFQFYSAIDSLDAAVINEEISNIHIKGRQLVMRCIRDNDKTELEKIAKYVSTLEPLELVNKYYNGPKDIESDTIDTLINQNNIIELSPQIILKDSHNAFNHGIVQSYTINVLNKGKILESTYNMYGNKRVKVISDTPEI
jgi:hypothetical protein